MISLITRYILFIQLIFSSFTTFSISVKTYQVRRINESTYLVTSFPELDSENHKRYSENITPFKVLTLNDDKKTTEDYDTTMSTVSTVTVGERKAKFKQKPQITAEFIKKARENYFRTYFAAIKKTNVSHSLVPEKSNIYINMVEVNNNETTGQSAKFKQNLITARKFAMLLINEAQYQADMKVKDKLLEEVKRKRRNMTNKKHRFHSFVKDLSWKHFKRNKATFVPHACDNIL